MPLRLTRCGGILRSLRALGELDLVPDIKHAVRIARLRFTEHMRMTTDDLRVDRATYIVDSELAFIGCDLTLQDYLQQHIAQLFAEVLGIVRFDRINRFIGFFEHIRSDGGMRLLAIPRTSIWTAQCCDRVDEFTERSRSFGGMRDAHFIRVEFRRSHGFLAHYFCCVSESASAEEAWA